MSDPARWRTSVRLALRGVRDLCTGASFRLVRPSEARRTRGRGLPERVVEVQPIRRSPLWENKLDNLRLAAARIQDVVVEPGECFSFWAAVGPPDASRGFREGRTILAGQARSSTGGGLCQLSGILYLLALRAGLAIEERHPHSVDLYTDETRFAPLGSDATVAYGRKDLRFRNVLASAFCLTFQVSADSLRAALHCAGPVVAREVEHRTVRTAPGLVHVETVRRAAGGADERVSVSCYRRSPAPASA